MKTKLGQRKLEIEQRKLERLMIKKAGLIGWIFSEDTLRLLKHDEEFKYKRGVSAFGIIGTLKNKEYEIYLRIEKQFLNMINKKEKNINCLSKDFINEFRKKVIEHTYRYRTFTEKLGGYKFVLKDIPEQSFD